MKAVSILYGYKRSCLKAINAGNNLVLISSEHNIISECIEYINKKMDKSLREDIDNSYRKIIRLKRRLSS